MYHLPNFKTADCIFKCRDLRMLLLLAQIIFAGWLRKVIDWQVPEHVLYGRL